MRTVLYLSASCCSLQPERETVGNLPSPKRALLILAAVLGSIFVYNFIRTRFAEDKLPDLTTLGAKK